MTPRLEAHAPPAAAARSTARRRRRTARNGVGTVCLLLALAACGGVGESGEDVTAAPRRVDDQGRVVLSESEREAVDLQVVTVRVGTLTTTRLRFGKVVTRPQEDTLVVAPVTGRLTATAAELGTTVARSADLVTLEPLVDSASRADLAAQSRQLQGQIEGARAQIEARRRELERVTTLVANGLATEAEQADAAAGLRSEEARAEGLQRAREELERMTEGHLQLQAPAPGVLVDLVTETGSLVEQGTVLARIVQPGPRWVDVAVPPGDPVGSGYRVQGVSRAVAARLLSRGGVVRADGTRRDRLQVAAGDAIELAPGAVVAVDVLSTTSGILSPAQSVVRRGADRLVFVEAEPGRYAPRLVQLGPSDGAQTVVTAGLASGERVVARGATSLLGELGHAAGESREQQ